jgi:surface protein
MFYCCISLSSVPDISKWDTGNIEDMSWMFFECKLLNSFPDISKWNIKKAKNMKFMFLNCNKLPANAIPIQFQQY